MRIEEELEMVMEMVMEMVIGAHRGRQESTLEVSITPIL